MNKCSQADRDRWDAELRSEKRVVDSSTAKISVVPLIRGCGSLELPIRITLYCPQCGEPVADKGQCSAELARVPDKNSKTGFIARLQVSGCRKCSCDGREPAID